MTVTPAGRPAVGTAGRPVDSISLRTVTNSTNRHRLFASGSSWRAEPHICRVELLDRRDVHRIVHVAGVIVRLVRVDDRVERGVLHDRLVRLAPDRGGRAG